MYGFHEFNIHFVISSIWEGIASAEAKYILSPETTIFVTSDLPEISAFAEERGKTSGAFVGVSLDVARLKINIQDTNDYYERMYDFENIYNNSPKASKYTLKFKEIISKYFL